MKVHILAKYLSLIWSGTSGSLRKYNKETYVAALTDSDSMKVFCFLNKNLRDLVYDWEHEKSDKGRVINQNESG